MAELFNKDFDVKAEDDVSITITISSMNKQQAAYLRDVLQNNIYGRDPSSEPVAISALRASVFNVLSNKLRKLEGS